MKQKLIPVLNVLTTILCVILIALGILIIVFDNIVLLDYLFSATMILIVACSIVVAINVKKKSYTIIVAVVGIVLIINAIAGFVNPAFQSSLMKWIGNIGILILLITNPKSEEKQSKKGNKMTKVKFYDTVADELLKFAVIISKSNGKWVFCKHKERNTFEVPGGHRETGEDILDTAKRELYEETGATEFDIKPICVYSVTADNNFNGEETFGMLYYAEISAFEKELHSEIEKIIFSDELVDNWTYPEIQPKLLQKAREQGII